MRKLLLILVVIPAIAFGQVTLEAGLKKVIIIEGNVSDVNGVPISGADLLIKGKSNVIKTDFDGNFNLKAGEGTVLIISCAGFKTKEITMGNQIKINITLVDEVKSENIKALTTSDIRKKRRADNKVRRNSRRRKNANTLDLKDEMLKGVGRSVKGAIRKNRKN